MTDTALPDVSADATSAWREHNAAGLAHAHDGAWDRAEQAFVRALEAAPCFADAPDAHALLLGNLAQARFHCGAWHEAVRLARHAEVARQVCGDEGDAPLARIRADLAVYLAATGAHEEARALLRAARTDLESLFGEFDTRLAPLLDNEVRLAILAEAPLEAEATRWRLQALLAQHSDASAAEARVMDEEIAERDAPEAFASPALDILASAEIEPSTEPEMADDDLFGALEFDDGFDLIEPTTASSSEAMASPSATGGLDLSIRNREPAMPPTPANLLGFEVQYGIPQDLLLDGDAA